MDDRRSVLTQQSFPTSVAHQRKLGKNTCHLKAYQGKAICSKEKYLFPSVKIHLHESCIMQRTPQQSPLEWEILLNHIPLGSVRLAMSYDDRPLPNISICFLSKSACQGTGWKSRGNTRNGDSNSFEGSYHFSQKLELESHILRLHTSGFSGGFWNWERDYLPTPFHFEWRASHFC